jgi:hypothetical protein
MWSNDELNAFQKHCFKEELGSSEIDALKKVIAKESNALRDNKVHLSTQHNLRMIADTTVLQAYLQCTRAYHIHTIRC